MSGHFAAARGSGQVSIRIESVYWHCALSVCSGSPDPGHRTPSSRRTASPGGRPPGTRPPPIGAGRSEPRARCRTRSARGSVCPRGAPRWCPRCGPGSGSSAERPQVQRFDQGADIRVAAPPEHLVGLLGRPVPGCALDRGPTRRRHHARGVQLPMTEWPEGMGHGTAWSGRLQRHDALAIPTGRADRHRAHHGGPRPSKGRGARGPWVSLRTAAHRCPPACTRSSGRRAR